MSTLELLRIKQTSNEYLLQYDPTREILGQIAAYDPELSESINRRVIKIHGIGNGFISTDC